VVVVDGTRLAVGGLSSGGGMAAAVCLMARDGGTARPRLQVLGVPALDLASDVPAGGTGGGSMISPSLRGLVRRVYFPDPAGRAEPYASPVLAPDLTGLPPAVVLTAEHDSLRGGGDTYAARLAAAGVPVLLHDVTPGADHYFLSHDLDRARRLMARVAQVVREQLVVDP
jgi:acetyl esterase